MALPSSGSGWSDPEWRWGSPVGKAHDLAMKLRGRLNRSRDVREEWIIELVEGRVSLEEAKLALGLRIQHAARAGIDGSGAGFLLMQEMAACKYEGQQGEENLCRDLEALTEILPSPPEKSVTGAEMKPDSDGDNRASTTQLAACAIAKTLLRMRFLADAL
uniref:Uncharacterized protein n=1 Tax=Chromera velia CCMP2878 TaxID=1169474 RepID=A0A0G4HXH7_9ALVE|eukprot:Cvel_1483.t1-p1 / transcript=Cvel_1483.t1 / gene=Cvel_1483 / organism=Chromera_velia_CCMP2878 / gene_product=hypothetical protein / transcript_product=hypothetical protein / location=Cvel_scaffold52:28745-29224(+) / protein_length=160 / sequence_SO=supercontig / SO=protein_coding / is_pseudo=false